MVIVPGFIIAWLTFPGVVVHELAHLLFCKLRRVAVFDVCFMRFSATGPAGYVIHERPDSFVSSLLISVGPFLVNSLLCVLLCFPAFIPVRIFEVWNPLSVFWLWMGVSIGMHAFPSTGDAQVLWSEAWAAAKRFNPLAIFSLPLVLVILLANIGSIIWLDLIYGMALGLGLPELVLQQVV